MWRESSKKGRKRRRVSRKHGIPVEIARNWLEYSRSVHTRDSGKVGKRVCGNICSSFIDVIMLLFLIKRIVFSSLSLALCSSSRVYAPSSLSNSASSLIGFFASNLTRSNGVLPVPFLAVTSLFISSNFFTAKILP